MATNGEFIVSLPNRNGIGNHDHEDGEVSNHNHSDGEASNHNHSDGEASNHNHVDGEIGNHFGNGSSKIRLPTSGGCGEQKVSGGFDRIIRDNSNTGGYPSYKYGGEQYKKTKYGVEKLTEFRDKFTPSKLKMGFVIILIIVLAYLIWTQGYQDGNPGLMTYVATALYIYWLYDNMRDYKNGKDVFTTVDSALKCIGAN